jgi:hypothetical protein
MNTEFEEVEEDNLNEIKAVITKELKKYDKEIMKNEISNLYSIRLLFFFIFCSMIYLGLNILLDVYNLIINSVNKYSFETCISRTIYFILIFIIQLIFSENEKLLFQEYEKKYMKRYMIINACTNIGIKVSTIIIIINIIFFFLTYMIKNINLEKEIMQMNLFGIGSNMMILLLNVFVGIILLKNNVSRKKRHITGLFTHRRQ